jgi:hypothetical protein
MIQYKVIADPGQDGVSVGDALQGDGVAPFQDMSNLGVYVACNFVTGNPQFFQPVN